MAIERLRIGKTKRQALYHEAYQSPLGEIYIVFLGEELVAIEFEKPHIKAGTVPAVFKKELDAYFSGGLKSFSQKTLFVAGTEFEKRVWSTLTKIPYGETRSYKWLAEVVGSPRAMRAVGRALSKNPIPIVFPCHRVIESTGKLGGYSSGEDLKRRLLAMEYYHLPEGARTP